jgi:PadR family transcriptional regulator, regulatory protein PadR
MKDRHLYSGLVRLHILHHAVRGDLFGMGLMEELRRHGYRLSAGTLYPILHGMEKSGYLVSHIESVDGRQRRVYTATRLGKETLRSGKDRVRELYRELLDKDE